MNGEITRDRWDKIIGERKKWLELESEKWLIERGRVRR